MRRSNAKISSFGLLANFLWTVNTVTAAPQTLPSLRVYRRGDDLPPVPSPYDPSKDTMSRSVSTRCSPEQVDQEALGWAEAGFLANALHAWVPETDYQNAMNMYMGTDSSDNSGFFSSYRQRIQDAVNHNLNLHDGTFENPGHFKSNYNLYTYCDENDSRESNICGDNGEGVIAYTYETYGWKTSIITVLCPNMYFKNETIPTLASQLKAIQDDPNKDPMVVDNLYQNKGHVYFHETFHWTAVTRPRALDNDPDDKNDLIYGPTKVAKKAAEKGTRVVSLVADAYALCGISTFLMQTFKLKDPPRPRNPDPASQDSLRVNFVTVDDVPEGWNPPGISVDANTPDDPALWVPAKKVQLNMADYQPIKQAPTTPTPPPPAPTQNVNNGILTCGTRTDMDNPDYWRDLEALNLAVSQFCTSLSKSSVFFSNKQSDLDQKLSVDKFSETSGDLGIHLALKYDGVGKPECLGASWNGKADYCKELFGTIINNCDTNSNGHKFWKQGGFFFRDCTTYTLEA